ncbi:hypothetical protein TRIUR3_03502 [Triticum urartu]|uniref:Enoyl reductase (ER) domain-containing protein n=1 Tax=Triticum urartu TaxID=4572 RepID=M7YQL9_TRIUA|nr:hypothetical protein TRIUR3_03502 [Triticum urartu]
MRAVAIASPGGPEVLEESEVEDLPAPGDGEIHGGSSGIGTFAIQMAKHLGIKVFVTAGVDVILDNVGGSYLQRNLDSLAVDVAGLRSRSLANKAQIVSEVERNVWPAVASGNVKPVVYRTLPLSEAAEAHKLMESSSHIGKILLIP